MKVVLITITAVLLALTAVVWGRIAWEKRCLTRTLNEHLPPGAHVIVTMHGHPSIGPHLQIFVLWETACHQDGKPPDAAGMTHGTVIEGLGVWRCQTVELIRD